MHISNLKAKNWKNFRKIDVQLEHRLFLIGPNASGKSNFLDIFRFLRDLSVSGGGLRQAVDVRRGGVSALRCLAARREPDIIIDVEIKGDRNDETWNYHLSFSQDTNRRPFIRKEEVKLNGQTILLRPDEKDQSDSLRLTETALEQTVANKDFRPVAQFFQSFSYQHLVPQAMRDPQGFSSGKNEDDPFGRDFLQRVENTSEKSRDSRLNKISAAMKVAVPQLEKLEVSRDNYGVPHLIGLYSHWRPNASKQNEAQFSDGTLRLFGLLWTLFEGDGPLLMEEPELSLHPEIVRHLPQIIEKVLRLRKIRRQVLISTHSVEMLDQASIGADEVLWLTPSAEGTLVNSPYQDDEARLMLESGLTVADVIIPKSAPENIEQLAFSF